MTVTEAEYTQLPFHQRRMVALFRKRGYKGKEIKQDGTVIMVRVHPFDRYHSSQKKYIKPNGTVN